MNVNKQFQIKFDLYIYIYIYICFRSFAHTPLVFSYTFLLQPPQGVEWRLKRHHFRDACCSWTSIADELFLERDASATICSWTVRRHVTAHICVRQRERGGERVFTKVKIIFSKCFDACLHQLILFITYLNFTSYSDIYNKIVFITML